MSSICQLNKTLSISQRTFSRDIISGDKIVETTIGPDLIDVKNLEISTSTQQNIFLILVGPFQRARVRRKLIR